MSFEALRNDLKEGNRFCPNKEDLADGGEDCEGDECNDNESGGEDLSDKQGDESDDDIGDDWTDEGDNEEVEE